MRYEGRIVKLSDGLVVIPHTYYSRTDDYSCSVLKNSDKRELFVGDTVILSTVELRRGNILIFSQLGDMDSDIKQACNKYSRVPLSQIVEEGRRVLKLLESLNLASAEYYYEMIKGIIENYYDAGREVSERQRNALTMVVCRYSLRCTLKLVKQTQ